MITKPKISAIEVTMPPKDALRFIVEKGFSRFPVYKGNIDKVVGILYNKDVFKILEEKRPLIISEAVRKPYFVPDSILISRLLREMQRRRTHMAMIVNEHGDVDGIVTIEDILEEIVGEIEDEFDIDKDGLIERQRDGSLLMDAAASLKDIKGVGLPFTDEDEDVFSTIAGFMLAKLQKIPKGGEFTDYKGFRFTVVDVAKRRIIKVKAETIGGR